MTDRLIKVLENQRLLTRGCVDMGAYVRIYADRDETLSYTVDWSPWLGSNTIASVSNESHGPTVTSTNTTTAATLTISKSPGRIEHRITDSAGQTKELRLDIRLPQGNGSHSYGCY